QTHFVTVTQFGVLGNCSNAVFSADSRFLAYTMDSLASVTVHDLFLRTNWLICTNCTSPSLNGDGRLVAFETMPNLNAQVRQVYLFDRATGQTNLVSVNRFGLPGNGHSRSPLLSPDGRFVVFASRASDLVDNDANNLSDIFVRDLVAANTLLVSLNLNGTGP